MGMENSEYNGSSEAIKAFDDVSPTQTPDFEEQSRKMDAIKTAEAADKVEPTLPPDFDVTPTAAPNVIPTESPIAVAPTSTPGNWWNSTGWSGNA